MMGGMGFNGDKLLSIASEALFTTKPVRSDLPRGSLGDELFALLCQKNGFYAFESALLLRGCGHRGADSPEYGLLEWNDDALWKHAYGTDTRADAFYFAEDIFGCQFAIDKSGVICFDPETGAADFLARDIESLAGKLLGDFEALTGHPLARAWQELNGPIERGCRLFPRVPFVAGGSFEVDNLRLRESARGMRDRATFARAIKDVPDGSTIRVVLGTQD